MVFLNIQQTDCESLKAEIKRLKEFMITSRMTESLVNQINAWIAEAEKKVAQCEKPKTLYGRLTPLIIVVGVVAAGMVAYKILKK